MKVSKDRLKEIIHEEVIRVHEASEQQRVDPFDVPSGESSADHKWYEDQVDDLTSAYVGMQNAMEREEREAVDPDEEMLADLRSAIQNVVGWIDALMPMVGSDFRR